MRAGVCAPDGPWRANLQHTLAPLVEGLEGADAFELDRRMRLYGRAPDALVIELPLARYRSGDVLHA